MGKLWGCVCLLMAVASAASPQTRGKAQVFAPGVISGKDVFGIAFTPDGKTAFFCQTDPEIKHIQILESHLSGTTWSEPKAANFSSGTYRDIDPLVTPDGKHLIFQSNRPFAGKAESRTDFDVYVMDRKGSDWSDPRPLAELNSEENDVFVSVTTEGTYYFSSERKGGKGKLDIYSLRRGSAVENLAAVNTDDSDGNPAIAPNGKFLIFTRAGDLYVSRKNGEAWSAPEKLPVINTDEDTEYAPAFSPDGKLLYFTSTKFDKGKRVKPGTIWSVPLSELGLPKAR